MIDCCVNLSSQNPSLCVTHFVTPHTLSTYIYKHCNERKFLEKCSSPLWRKFISTGGSISLFIH